MFAIPTKDGPKIWACDVCRIAFVVGENMDPYEHIGSAEHENALNNLILPADLVAYHIRKIAPRNIYVHVNGVHGQYICLPCRQLIKNNFSRHLTNITHQRNSECRLKIAIVEKLVNESNDIMVFIPNQINFGTQLRRIHCKLCDVAFNSRSDRLFEINRHVAGNFHVEVMNQFKLHPEKPFEQLRLLVHQQRMAENLKHIGPEHEIEVRVLRYYCKLCDSFLVEKQELDRHVATDKHQNIIIRSDGYSHNQFFDNLTEYCITGTKQNSKVTNISGKI